VIRTPGADNVSYTVAVENVGDSSAGATSVALTNSRASVASATVPPLAPGESRTATLTVDVRDLNRYAPTRVRIDPADRVGEGNETNNDRVVATTLPDLTLSRERASFDADDRELAVTVGNRGPGATDAVVAVSAGNATTSRRTSVPGAPAGSDAVDTAVRVPLAGLSLVANETVLVRVDPDAPESNTTDNLIAVTVPEEVGGPPPVVGDAVPTDPDGDGRYEDVDGNGEFSVVDVAVLLDNLDAPAVTDTPGFFDFKTDGSINVIDVAELLGET